MTSCESVIPSDGEVEISEVAVEVSASAIGSEDILAASRDYSRVSRLIVVVVVVIVVYVMEVIVVVIAR